MSIGRPGGLDRIQFSTTLSVPKLKQQWVAFSRAGAPNSNNQCYIPANVTVANSNLVITSLVQNCSCQSFDELFGPYSYSSGFVAMKDFNFLYGTVEARMKFGGGANSGCWPVLWMADINCQASDPTGTNDLCNGQEIDVVEIMNGDFTHINQQIHVNNFLNNDQGTATVTDASLNWHTYKLTWAPGSLVWNIDGVDTTTITQVYVPNAPMYVKLSVNVGSFGGTVNNNTFPWTTYVDYIKVTQNSQVIFFDDF